MWYFLFRLGFAAVFTGLHCVLMIGLFMEQRREQRLCREGRQRRALPNAPRPRVSVIIPVRNEKHCLADLLQSLGMQDYPEAEYIFIDDRSSDESAGLVRGFAQGRKSVRLITLTENPGPNHKQYALARGIEHASGDFFLFTDADCVVPRDWVSAMLERMSSERVGALIGPVFKNPEGSGFFQLFQCFDHAVRYMYLAGSTGLGAAGGGFGNNLMLRAEALKCIGGYDAVPPSPTEDAALISRLRARSNYQIRAAVGAETHVLTRKETSWRAFINQTLRWNNGGLFSPDPVTRFNFRFLMAAISIGVLALPALAALPSLWPLSASVLFSMALNSIASLALFGSSLPNKGAAYLVQALFTPLYFTFLTILGFCRAKVTWKDAPLS
jgi:cellulose synthase/poly-beta-1,6-N-acetylglucosamine synthase-like glycosyltransferase